jgi:hypothetical protein
MSENNSVKKRSSKAKRTADIKPRRLAPHPATIKELFAVSLNRCAFPNCANPIVDVNGSLLGEICHIEAAMSDGERFNAKMSNEDRRKKSNLILLCSNHHIVTNNTQLYPSEKMREMKINHESKATLAVADLGTHFQEVIDLATTKRGRPPNTLNALANFLGVDDPADIQRELSVYIKLHTNLMGIPDHIRKLFAIVLKKMAEDPSSDEDWYQVRDTILRNDCGGIGFDTFADYMSYLQNKDLISLDVDDEDGTKWTLSGFAKDNYLHWMVTFCLKKNVNFYDLIVKGDFTLLD